MMNVIVCGGGQVGSTIAMYLSQEDAHVTLIDNDPDVIRWANDHLEVRAMQGHASHPDVLMNAGAKNAEMIIAVTSSDEVNIVACQVAHTLFDIPMKLARLRHRNYLDAQYSDMFSEDHMPINYVMSPEIEVVDAIVQRLSVPGAADVVSLGQGKVHLLGIHCAEDCPVLNTSFIQLPGLFKDLKMRAISLIREGETLPVTNDEQIHVGDTVYVLVATEHIRRAMAAFGHEEKEAHRLLIAGGNNVGVRLAQQVEEMPDVSAKIIEFDKEQAKNLAVKLQKTTVLHGDILSSTFLEDIGITKSETFVAVTNDDEFNIMACLLAKKNHCPRVVTLLNTATYESLTAELGIDVSINPRSLTISRILQHVRRGRVRSVYAAQEDFGEIMELDILKDTAAVHKSVADLKLPDEVMVVALIRDNEVIFASDKTTFQEGDRVITYAAHDAVKDFARKFSKKG